MWKELALGLSVVLISTGHGLWISVDKPDGDFTFVDEAETVQNLEFLMGKAEEFETRLTKQEDISDTIVSKSGVVNHKLDSMATTLNDVVDGLENHLLKIEGMERRLKSLEGRLEENYSLHTDRDFNSIQEYIFEPAKYHVEESEAEITEPKVREEPEVTEVPRVVEEPEVTEVPIVMDDAKFTEELDVTEEPEEL
ncbi:hypothetical protein CHS0354_038438 [Potamilus streckersoni]|uniref:Uncharacterized protein n=1 Tax=Potamilus streckersoni TaxID=2493646 RepID=A0AAE0VQW3_9BIVA|nr:hypothetical protein CHS0354_038438 [Potamilus streckersoni]